MSDEPADSGAKQTPTLSFIRHELMTPLNQIIGYTEMLKEDAQDQGLDEMVADLDKVHQAARDLVKMVQSYLASPPAAD